MENRSQELKLRPWRSAASWLAHCGLFSLFIYSHHSSCPPHTPMLSVILMESTGRCQRDSLVRKRPRSMFPTNHTPGKCQELARSVVFVSETLPTLKPAWWVGALLPHPDIEPGPTWESSPGNQDHERILFKLEADDRSRPHQNLDQDHSTTSARVPDRRLSLHYRRPHILHPSAINLCPSNLQKRWKMKTPWFLYQDDHASEKLEKLPRVEDWIFKP